MTADLAWFKSSYSDTAGGNCIEVATSWRKSSYSDSNGGACVEVAASWRKSSHSNTEGGDCIEIAALPGTVHVRDSKDAGGPQLAFGPGEWREFVRFAAGYAEGTA